MNKLVSIVAVLCLAGCNSSTGGQHAAENRSIAAQSSEAQPPIPAPATGPDARTPLAKPKDTIDPKSAEAAARIVQQYGALIEQHRWAEARELWSDANAATQFERRLRTAGLAHVEIGNPGDSEGAAGSIYVTVPAVFYGGAASGRPSRLQADVILRRVNDVPGSTEEQRRWHIERIDAAG